MRNKLIILTVVILFSLEYVIGQSISPYLSIGNKNAITALLFAKKGSLLVSVDKSGKCVIWDFFERREVNSMSLNKVKNDVIDIVDDTVLYLKNKKEYRTLPQLTVLENYQPGVPKTQVSPFMVVAKSNRLKLYHNNRLVRVISGITDGYTYYGISANDSLMAHVSGDHYLVLRTLKDPGAYRQIDVGSNTSILAFHTVIPQLVAVGTESGEIKIYDVRNHQYIFSFASDLLNPFAVNEDIDHKNVIINTINNSYVFNYRDLQLLQFSLPFVKLKPNEAYLHIYDDSLRNSFFYYWKNNYTLNKFTSDTAVRIAGFGAAEYHDKYVRRISSNEGGLSGTIFPHTVTGKGHYYQTPDLQYEPQWDIAYNLSGKVIFQKGKEQKLYRSTGENGITFAQDDSTIVTLRNPAYINLISKFDRFKPVNYFLYDRVNIYGISAISNSFFALKNIDSFRVLKRTGNTLKVVSSLKGNFINSGPDAGEFYYTRDSSVVIHDLALNQETCLKANTSTNLLFVKKIVINNKVYGYLLFYDIGVIEYRSANDKLIGIFYCYNNGEFIFM
ncbi:MAG: hypothetical protein ABI203_03490, partial [Mucilaginibacter sp.]